MTELRWISGPVFSDSRALQAAGVRLRFGRARIGAPLNARLYEEAGKIAVFERGQRQVVTGLAADRR